MRYISSRRNEWLTTYIYPVIMSLKIPEDVETWTRPILAATGELHIGQDIMHWKRLGGSVCRTVEYILRQEYFTICISALSAKRPAASSSEHSSADISPWRSLPTSPIRVLHPFKLAKSYIVWIIESLNGGKRHHFGGLERGFIRIFSRGDPAH